MEPGLPGMVPGGPGFGSGVGGGVLRHTSGAAEFSI
jgi:hypothetical protein